MRSRGRAWCKAMPAALLIAAAAPAPVPIPLPGDTVFPESITITPDGMPSEGTAYVSSLSGGVFKASLKTGKLEQWIKPGAFGTSSTFGVLVDPIHKLLWVCSNDLSANGLAIAGGDKAAMLKGFDLATGQGKISLKLPGPAPSCNDIAVAKNGFVYVTDVNASQVLRWKPGTQALEPWCSDPRFNDQKQGGLDGIAFGADGQLYLNNWRSSLIWRVTIGADGAAGAVTQIATSRPLSMTDGMRPIGGNRFALVEGTGGVVLLSVSGDRAEVTTLASNLGKGMTGVDVHGGRAWYVQGQFDYVFMASRRGKKPPVPFGIVPVPLPTPLP